MAQLEFPPPGEWRRGDPASLGFRSADLEAAGEYAVASEIDWPIDVGGMVARDDPPPHNRIIGPTAPRGPATGVVVKDGVIAAEWGDPTRVDMTFSATKSYLATCVGLALDRGLIRSVDDRVKDYVPGDMFAGEHNAAVTWKHLLQQTSEWRGELFRIPDTVDHNRSLTGPGGAAKGERRELNAPGTFWEYNDVRVNALGVAALHVWREPLADVLRREIMDPIGASLSWAWHHYRNAVLTIDDKPMPSVPGGGHWGGGLFINTLDHARFGLLMLARGRWGESRLLSEDWVDAALTPCDINPRYGFMWWLNPASETWRRASTDAFAAIGAGGNVVCAIPEHNLVVVTRWASDPNGVVDRMIDAIRG